MDGSLAEREATVSSAPVSLNPSSDSILDCWPGGLFIEEGPFLVNRLLNAGQPWHPSAPPVPLQRPPPGQEPGGCCGARRSSAGDMASVKDAEGLLRRRAGAFSARLGPDEMLLPALPVAGRFKFLGREVLRALRYKPQALQIVDPAGERRQSGVLLVPQLLS